MPSEEMVHVSPMEVTPTLGKGAQDTWRFPRSVWVAGLIKPAQRRCWPRRRGWGQTRKGQGRIRTSVLTSPSLGKAHGRKPRFQTGPGKSGRPGL